MNTNLVILSHSKQTCLLIGVKIFNRQLRKMFELYYVSVTATLHKQNIIFAGEFNLIHLVSCDEKFLIFAYFTITTTIKSPYVWFSEERVVTTKGKSEVSLNVKTLSLGSIFRDEYSPKNHSPQCPSC